MKIASKSARAFLENLNVIQPILAPRMGLPVDLYCRYISHSPQTQNFLYASDKVKYDFTIRKGEKLSTNTYFNSFYQSYWKKYTNISDLYIIIKFRGDIVVEIFKDAPEGQCFKIAEVESSDSKITCIKNPDKTSTIIIPVVLYNKEYSLSEEHKDGRIFVDVYAKSHSYIYSMNYATTSEKVRDVSLSIGICTFNRDQYLYRTLKRIKRISDQMNSIKSVYIVNQGNRVSENIYREYIYPKNTIFHIIEQKNLGGCGGFTRTMLEAINSNEEITHHLLMDDDIVLDERIIIKSILFLEYATQNIALGGGMLDSERPATMYEAGAFLHPNNYIRPYAHNVDLSDFAGLSLFNSVVETDYNAWWYCIIPLNLVSSIGLPAPIFIRGDDFEYGQRLSRHGVPTITLPGVAVWHEPFYVKQDGWQQYYDLRNRLIFGATYQDKVRQVKPATILGIFMISLLTHNYAKLALLHKAVEDYMSGPDALFSIDSEKKHKEIIKIYRSFPLISHGKGVEHLLSYRPGAPRVEGAWKRGGMYLWRILTMLFLPLGNSKPPNIIMDADVRPETVKNDRYIVTNGPRTYFVEYRPNRKQFLKRLIKSIRIFTKYKIRYKNIIMMWKGGINKYRKQDYWRTQLGEE